MIHLTNSAIKELFKSYFGISEVYIVVSQERDLYELDKKKRLSVDLPSFISERHNLPMLFFGITNFTLNFDKIDRAVQAIGGQYVDVAKHKYQETKAAGIKITYSIRVYYNSLRDALSFLKSMILIPKVIETMWDEASHQTIKFPIKVVSVTPPSSVDYSSGKEKYYTSTADIEVDSWFISSSIVPTITHIINDYYDEYGNIIKTEEFKA